MWKYKTTNFIRVARYIIMTLKTFVPLSPNYFEQLSLKSKVAFWLRFTDRLWKMVLLLRKMLDLFFSTYIS